MFDVYSNFPQLNNNNLDIKTRNVKIIKTDNTMFLIVNLTTII